MVVKNLTSKNFNEFIKTGASVIDFYADWCGPCKILSPIFEETSGELENVKFGKVDVDKEFELAQRFHVLSIPTTIFFKYNEQVDRTIGVIPKKDIISRALKISKK